MSTESNPCKDRGCAGRCCYDQTLYIPAQESRQVFQQAKSVPIDRLDSSPEPIISCFAGYLGIIAMEYVKFRGACPHLSTDGECQVHDQRTSACRNFQVDSEECIQIQWEG